MIARIFGGSGNLDNLVAMDRIVNTSEYRIIENAWKKALIEGKKVDVKIKLVYSGSNKRPKEFNIKYMIDDKVYEKTIVNGR